MYDTQTRIDMVKVSARKMKEKQRNAWITRLSVLCCVLVGQEMYLISYLGSGGQYHSEESWMFGATMLFTDAGGYVLVAVLTFVLAAILTGLCMRSQEKKQLKKGLREQKEEDER
ncbi:hypothetical protein [Chakrabartyella piscis]|uniref:hypothetical protein n=1 Tax=Chakrabartyella piscis TaxID=2918914 RepID=UPI002958CC95|nr:hypothetical protein [Chakrabartyella piscis]